MNVKVGKDWLTGKVKQNAKMLGAGIVGVGTIDRWMNAPNGHKPRDFLPTAKSCVTIGLPLFRAMATRWRDFMKGSEVFTDGCWVEGLPNRYRAAQELYGRMMYDTVNLELQRQIYLLGRYLDDLGYDVVVLPPTGGGGFNQIMVREMNAICFHQWSPRHAAVACGLGEMGLNNAFICPEYGIRVRVTSLFTNAELTPDPLNKIGTVCTKCEQCINACPQAEEDGIGPFGERYTHELIPGYALEMCMFNKARCPGAACNACLVACPVGQRRYISRKI